MAKFAGEAVPVQQKPASPEQAVNALNHLPEEEKIKVLDYLQSAMSLTQHEPKQ